MLQDDERNLDKYLEEAARVASVPSDERVLINLAAAGDENARQDLVRAYLAVTADVGLRLAPSGMTRLDAVREANLVLINLIQGGSSIGDRLESAIQEHFSKLS